MYVQARLKIRYGQINAFARAFPPVIEAMANQGWTLEQGYQSVIGDFSWILHIWHVEDANTVTDGLFGALAEPGMAEALKPLADLVLEETIELCVPLPYVPNAEGE